MKKLFFSCNAGIKSNVMKENSIFLSHLLWVDTASASQPSSEKVTQLYKELSRQPGHNVFALNLILTLTLGWLGAPLKIDLFEKDKSTVEMVEGINNNPWFYNQRIFSRKGSSSSSLAAWSINNELWITMATPARDKEAKKP